MTDSLDLMKDFVSKGLTQNTTAQSAIGSQECQITQLELTLCHLGDFSIG